jgi:hypothetical protein
MRDQTQRLQRAKVDSMNCTIAAQSTPSESSLALGVSRLLIALPALALAACATQLTQAPPSPAQPQGGVALAFQQ